MSIILKGIDLPPNSKVQIIVESPTESFRKQMPKSRIIQIPKGHGDIKDINTVEDELDERCGQLSAEIVRNAPTVLDEEGE